MSQLSFMAGPREAFRVGMTPAFTAARTPDLMCVVSDAGDRTFGELNAHANQLVRVLRARGLVAGDAVALMCSNRPEFVETYAATMRAGFRLTAINWHLQADEAGYIVRDCEAKAFLADARAAEVAAAAAEGLPASVLRVAIGGSIPGFQPYEALLAEHAPEDIDDPVFGSTMLYTSGTTGRPKGVTRPRAAQQPTVVMRGVTAPMKSGESVALCTGPLYHAAPFAYNLAQPLHRGVGTVLMDRWDAEQTLRLVERHRVTHTHMVATMFHRMLALPDEVRRGYDLSSLQLVIHGAAPTPVHVKQAMMEWIGPVLFEYYAGTEGGGTSISAEDWLARPGSVGRPIQGRVLEILDDEGRALPPGEVGRVFFHAPEAGGFEYYKDPEKTASAYDGNRFTLGDHGYVDEEGYLFLTGRTSEVIISGGVNIYPAEVDAVLLMHPDVVDAAAVGVPNDEFGEEVKAVVVPSPARRGDAGLEQELIAFCREHLAHFKCPRSVDFVAELPRSDAGKIYRRRVREPYWRGLGREM
jgi:long-chain acyl-CoA synthetase